MVFSNIGLNRGTLPLSSPNGKGTKRKNFMLFVFRKYPRAQITPFQTYIAENLLNNLDFL